MRRIYIFKTVVFIAVAMFFCVGCEKDEPVPIEEEKPTITTFVDFRDAKTYKKVKIGTQEWMAENLDYDIPGDTVDRCYANRLDNCAKYGRLYRWEAALSACPSGWHLPTIAEWTTLIDYAGGESTAGRELKARGWYNDDSLHNTILYTKATDKYGFSAEPGGRGFINFDGEYVFEVALFFGHWWTATEFEGNNTLALYILMDYGEDKASSLQYNKLTLSSVRCLKNES